MFRTPLLYAPGILSGNAGSDPTHTYDVDLRYHNWGQAASFASTGYRHVTFGYNCYLAAGPHYRVVKTTGLNLISSHFLHVYTKPG